MFETEISPNAPTDGVQEDGLRPLDWQELVARFAAVRDLRRVLNRAPSGGSFANPAAASIASGNQGKRDVNPNGSTDIKCDAANRASDETQTYDGEQKLP